MSVAATKVLRIRATWDEEARVWVAESEDLPGLATEAESLDTLLAKLRIMIPELIEANDGELTDDVPFELLAREHAAARP